MIKVFQVVSKIGLVPVMSMPELGQKVIESVQKCKKFNDYVAKMQNLEQGIEVKKIELLNVEMFGNNVGFVNFRAITHKNGCLLPSYVFLRGQSVAILMLINNQILLVEQYRVPTQKTLLEAPAGMLDESGDFTGTAAKQILEQTGIKITGQMLKPLGSIYPSPGGCDEEIIMYYCQMELPQEELNSIQNKIHGQGPSEKIKVKLIQYLIPTVLNTKDAKLIALVLAHQNAKNNNNPNL